MIPSEGQQRSDVLEIELKWSDWDGLDMWRKDSNSIGRRMLKVGLPDRRQSGRSKDFFQFSILANDHPVSFMFYHVATFQI